MIVETAGIAAAAATFGSVWFGHVAVRWLEFRVARLWLPQAAFAVVGLGFAAFSLSCACANGSVEAGIVGIVFIYDAFELSRQWRRVREGRAVANQANPRHRAVFDSGLALDRDLFAKDPARPAYKERPPK